jgi:hypothetical protein
MLLCHSDKAGAISTSLAEQRVVGPRPRTWTRGTPKPARQTREINDPLTDNDAAPFSGFKFSGGSRELGEEGLEEFRETRHVHWDFEGGAKSWWYPCGR